MSFRTLTSTFSSPSLFSSSDPSLLTPPPMPPPSTSSFSSSSPPSAASSISSSSSASLSSLSSASPLIPRTRLAWRAPSPSPRRRPLPYQWMHPTTTTTTSTLTPTSPTSSSCSTSSTSSTTSSSVDRAATPPSPSLAPSSHHDPLTLRLSAFMNDPSSSLTTTSSRTSSISSSDRPPRIQQHPTPLLQQRLSLSAPCSPALSSRPSQLVFASGAVGTASALGHVFGRPLQAKETIPCSPLNCPQWQKEPPQSLAQQAQSPSHTFQQQCAVHKRFRLFRQRPRRCQVHASSYHHGTTSSNGPNYILPPTTVYPLVVHPDKILLEHHEEPPIQESWWPSLTSSISMSSRLSLSTVSLSLSATNTTTSSTASFQTHGSEDDESSFLSNGGTYYSSSSSSSKAKKLSKKERQLQKQLQKQEQQRQQQQQQRLRCLCYLDTSLDNQPQEQPSQQPQKQHSSQQQQQQSKISSWHPKRNSKDKKEKDKEAAGRLRRIWNESVIFHWSKPPGSGGSGSRQSASSSPSPSPPSSGYHHHTVNGGESLQNSNGSQVDIGSGSGVPMRHSMSGTDISDEGNHSLSDIEDDLDIDTHLRHLRQGTSANHSTSSPANDNNSYNHHRVSFQGPYGASSSSAKASSSSRPKEDLKAIARHQAELSLHQQPRMGGDDFQYGLDDDDAQLPSMPSMPPPPPPVLSNFGSHIIVNDNDEDDEDEDWDIQSDSGAPSSSPMYSANAREPSCRSTLALPMSTPANNKAYLKKSSNANLGSIRSRQRCLSLPADTVPSSKGFMMSSKPSENWDEDFDIGSADIHVPSKVVENQMSLQMDLYNIKDFASQIEDLKTLRASLRMASSSLKATNPKRHQDLSMLFQRDWEQAEVIIDLGEIAQTSSPTTTSPSSASSSLGPSSLQHAGKKSSEPSLGTLSTKPSMGLKPRRPALSTTAPASNNNNNPLDALSAYQSSQARSESQSSNLTGATLVAGVGSGDAEGDDTAGSTRTSSRASSSTSTSGSGPLRVNIECAIERLAIPQKTPSTSPSITRDSGRATTGNGNGMRKASMAFMKESCSSPAGLGLCTSLMKPLRKHNNIDYDDDDEDYDDYNDGDLEIKYENGLLRFPEGEQPFKGGYHDKEDSSATVKPLRSAGGSPRSPRESGMFQVDMEASFRRYQKYSHYSKRRTTGGVAVPSSGTSRRLSNQDDYDDDADEDEEEEDDGYESYGYGDGSSIGVFTPIPSDRHMQVLKDILMEGLGTEKARQYMFKQGEQDHVRFSVEVIPGLLGHLKALQQRLGSQLVVLQELTVIV